jgi:hypothetical protein
MASTQTLFKSRLQRERRLAYLRDYFARRYANDPEFRERHRASSKAYYRRLKAAASNATGAGNDR